MDDNVIQKKKEYKAMGLRGFGYNLFEEEEGGSVRKGTDGYPYLKHLIEFWTGDWEKQFLKMNEMVCEQVRHQKEAGKSQSARIFSKNEFWKFIG